MMQKSDRCVNLLLATLVAALLAICVISVVRQMQSEKQKQETKYADSQ